MRQDSKYIILSHTGEMPAAMLPMNWSQPMPGASVMGIPDVRKGATDALKFPLELIDYGWYQLRESGKTTTYAKIADSGIVVKPIEYGKYSIMRMEESFGDFFPKMEGSQAQITWATRIRAETLMAVMESEPSGLFPLRATQHLFMTRWAHWWIENMDNVVADTLLSIKRWNEEPAFRSLVADLPPLDGATIPMITWASRLRQGCVLAMNMSASNVEMALLASRLFLRERREARWWIDNAEDIKAVVARERRKFAAGLVRQIPRWDFDGTDYRIPDDAPIQEDVAFLKSPDNKWHIFTRELPF
jgi:hypothetical protein